MEAESQITNSSESSSLWKYLFTDLADPRVQEWFLMSNPIPLVLIIFSYLYFVLKCGPRYMENRKPYDLKGIIMIYNLLQVAANLYLFITAVHLWKGYSWNCQPVDYSPNGLCGVWACYLYFLNKLSDFADTVFFTLRKKKSQVSFLHVFHHAMMPAASWIIVKYVPGGHTTFVGLLNTFVHVILYGYYFLAALGPQVQKYLWWKKYITRLQLIQFGLVFIHSLQLFIFDCGYPKWTVFMTLPNAVFFYYLFNDFYNKSYKTSSTDKKPKLRQKTK